MNSDSTTIINASEIEGEDNVLDTKSMTLSVPDFAPTSQTIIHVASLLEKAKFYTSLCLGITAILSAFAFLFLIPFVVEPAISTILANFSPNQVACVSTEHVFALGQKNCSWASCREGKAFFNFIIIL